MIMNALQVFTNERLGQIRSMNINGQPYFVGKDIADALGYSNSRDALAKHVHDDDKITVAIHDGNKGNPNQVCINESGMYALIFGSKLEQAKEFKHWVTSEVLPSIRKTGGYNSQQSDEYKAKRIEVMAMNAKARIMKEENKRLEALLKSGKVDDLPATAILSLIKTEPQHTVKTYTAQEVGAMLGVSANKIGRLANANNLKTEEYGEWFKETINNGDKQVPSFRYNDKGIKKLTELVKR